MRSSSYVSSLAFFVVAFVTIASTQAQYIKHPFVITEGELHVSSSDTGTNEFNGLNINRFLGAERFYNEGYTGSSAILANIEAGHTRRTHETLSHITEEVTGNGATGQVDEHATNVSHALGGRFATPNYPTDYHAYGIGFGAELWTGAIATSIDGLSFNFSRESLATTYSSILQSGVDGRTADVFNSSWGFEDPTGSNGTTIAIDGLISETGKVSVFSAGNSGSGPNTVGGVGAGYNSITVGALGSDTIVDPYDSLTGFSSRSPNDFFHAGTGEPIQAVRAAVDITAPGRDLTLARSNGDTNYRSNRAGTSFSSPLVAGGAGLIVDAGRTTFGTDAAIDGRVVKSILLNSADKTPGWDNGQVLDGGVIQTAQSLDWGLGAGRMNLNEAYDQYMPGSEGGRARTTDVSGLLQGDLGDVSNVGWDFGQVTAEAGAENFYFVDQKFRGGTEFTATLSWFADRISGSPDDFSGFDEDHLANLDLTIFEFDNLTDRNILDIVATSNSLYNVVEHLHFAVPETGFYGISVSYTDAHWDFNDPEAFEQYGLAWSGTAVPEPAALPLLGLAAAGFFYWRRRRRSPAKGELRQAA